MSLHDDLLDLLHRAMSDGAALVPIDALFDLIEREPREVEQHEIFFPGASHTWLMRHPAGCPGGKACAYTVTARRQYPAHDSFFAPGSYGLQLSDNHLSVTRLDTP